MNTFVVLSCLVAAACGAPQLVHLPTAETLVRAPAHDSAVIESHRLGGNFAYATAEAHAYAKVTPKLATITEPVAETTHVHQPAPIHTVQPAPIVTSRHVAEPVLAQQAVYAQQPVVGPVAAHTTVKVGYTRTAVATPTIVAAAPAIHAAAPAYAHGAYAAAPAYAHGAYAAAPAYAHGAYAAAAPAYSHGAYAAAAPAYSHGAYVAGAPALAHGTYAAAAPAFAHHAYGALPAIHAAPAAVVA